MVESPESTEIWQVVISLEDQYSIWPIKKEIPFGLKAIDKLGTKAECLSYIKEVWTDMRPRSLKDITMKTIT